MPDINQEKGMEPTIVHDEKKKRFVCVVDGLESSVDYETDGAAAPVIDIYRTFVHPDLRGKGLAEALLKRLSDHALQNGWRVKPTCSYAQLYYRRSRRYASLIADGASLTEGGSCRLPQGPGHGDECPVTQGVRPKSNTNEHTAHTQKPEAS